jgi:transcription elongation GreA/GreB family factor
MAAIIYITALDQRRLHLLADSLAGNEYMNHYAKMLVEVLESAKVVRSEEIPGDVVTMNSRLRYAYLTAHGVK